MGLMTPAHMRVDAETSSQNQNHIHMYYLEIEQLHQIVEEQQGGKLLWQPVTSRRSVTYSPGDVLSEHEPTVHVVRTGGLVGLDSKERQKTSRVLRFQPLVEQHRDPHPAAVGQKKGGQSERLPNNERTAKVERLPQGSPLSRKDRCAKLHGCTLPGRRCSFQELRSLHPPGCPRSSEAPYCAVTGTWPDSPPSLACKTPPPPTAASPCMLHTLALAVEMGTAAWTQEIPLTSQRFWAPVLRP